MSITVEFENGRVSIGRHQAEDLVRISDRPNATLFHPKDSASGYRYGERKESYRSLYERLWLYHTGLYNGKWRDESKMNCLDRLYLFEAIADELELTPYQKSEARRLIETPGKPVDFRRFNKPNSGMLPSLTGILAICAYICFKDGRRCHPNHKEKDELFEHMMNRLDIPDKFFRKVYGRLEQDLRKPPALPDFEDEPFTPLPGEWWPYDHV